MCGKSFGTSVSPINFIHIFLHCTGFTDSTFIKYPQYMMGMLQVPLVVYKFLALSLSCPVIEIAGSQVIALQKMLKPFLPHFFKNLVKNSSLHTVDVDILQHLIYSLIKNGILVFL